jgi:arylsulfatase A-like enzyme
MHWTGQLPEGRQYPEPVIALDVVPTALAAAGVAAPAARKLDGVNLLPHVTAKALGRPHEHLYWRILGGRQSAVRDSQYKLIRGASGSTELYDLQADIGETKDLAREKPAVVKSLSASLAQWNRTLSTPKWENSAEVRFG